MVKQPKEVTPEQALARLKRSCSLRETCSQAVMRKLIQWRISSHDAVQILQTLISEKWVDDSRYAEAFTREKSRLDKWGPIKIRTYLQAKQIPATAISHALNQIETRDEGAIIEELLSKKARSIKAKSTQDLLAKLLRFGISRGYEYEQVVKIARKTVKGME